MKRCTKCGVEQPLENFYKAADTRDGRRGDCRSCFAKRAAERHAANPEPGRERARRWQQENPERVRAQREKAKADGRRAAQDRRTYLKRKYGMTVEQYDEMLAAQDGGCAICGRPPTPGISLHVDHDHETGAIRRLLCFLCNNLLGDAGDDPSLLEKAAAYLRSHDPVVQEERALVKSRVRALLPAEPTLF